MIQLNQSQLASNQQIGSQQISSEVYVPARRRQAEIHLHAAENVLTSISGPEAPDRKEIEQFVHTIFRNAYQADVNYFMPQLMSLRNTQGDLMAVCGLRHAEDDALFLERYLDQPVEHAIGMREGIEVQRNEIVEIGNLAVGHPETTRSLLSSIGLYLHGTGTTWGVFTGIPSLRNSLTKLHMHLVPLAAALKSRLPANEQASWGSYYDEKPYVMAVRRIQP